MILVAVTSATLGSSETSISWALACGMMVISRGGTGLGLILQPFIQQVSAERVKNHQSAIVSKLPELRNKAHPNTRPIRQMNKDFPQVLLRSYNLD